MSIAKTLPPNVVFCRNTLKQLDAADIMKARMEPAVRYAEAAAMPRVFFETGVGI